MLAFGPLGDAAPTSRREARTDLGGRFQLDGVPRGRYTLLVEAVRPRHHRAARRRGAWRRAGHPACRGRGGRSRASSCRRGAPASGARVRLGGGTLARATLSDDAGRFVFHGLGPGDLRAPRDQGWPGLADPRRSVDRWRRRRRGRRRRRARRPRASSSPRAGRSRASSSTRGGAASRAPRCAPRLAPDDPLAEVGATVREGQFALGPLPTGAIPRRRARAGVPATRGRERDALAGREPAGDAPRARARRLGRRPRRRRAGHARRGGPGPLRRRRRRARRTSR